MKSVSYSFEKSRERDKKGKTGERRRECERKV